MTKKVPLAVTANATFISDGAGGTVARSELAPAIYGTTWKVDRIMVNTTSAADSVFTVYQGTEAPAAIVDTTESGNNDISETDIFLNALDKLRLVWTGGTLGAQCRATLYGEVDTGRP